MQTIYLDIANKGVIPCIQAKQSEVGRKFLAVITDNGVPYNIPDNALLSVWYEGDTDAGNYSSIEEKSAFSIDGNKVAVELVAQMLLKPGNGELCLSITHGNGGETNTWNIPYCVEYKPGAGSSVPTEYYTALTEAGAVAAEHATNARNDAQIAQDSKEYVVNALKILTPVGYVFSWQPVYGDPIDLSTPENVAAHFGFGIWEQVKDRFLLAAGDSYAIGTIGGESEHTLTIEEMPTHGHRSVYASANGTFASGFSFANKGALAGNTSIESSLIENTGGNQPHNIMPPYTTVYVWKRIA